MAKTVCSIKECGRNCHGQGLCPMHYHRWQRYGDPSVVRKVNLCDLAGQTFERLTVLRKVVARNESSRTRWHCICECGKKCIITTHELRSRHTRSCGCLRRELDMRGGARVTHGATRGPRRRSEYGIWAGMKDRCQNPNNSRYRDWGGRGIGVCKRWQESFADFFTDMGARPSSDHTIDRKNNDLDYSPDNCTWSTRAEQNRNKRARRWAKRPHSNDC